MKLRELMALICTLQFSKSTIADCFHDANDKSTCVFFLLVVFTIDMRVFC